MDLTPAATVAACAAVVALGLAVALVVTAVGRRRVVADLASSREELAALRVRVDRLAAGGRAPTGPGAVAGPDAAGDGDGSGDDYLITTLASGPEAGSPVVDPVVGVARPSAADFVGLAVGESLVRAVSLGHGVRRALSAENRHRIRFEVRREVRRSRRQRRIDVKQARRHLRSQEAAVASPAGGVEDAA